MTVSRTQKAMSMRIPPAQFLAIKSFLVASFVYQFTRIE
jgi:hypothetical protein